MTTGNNNQQKKQEDTKKLKEELEEKTKLAEERLNQLKYLQADFDNYRKNFEKEKNHIIQLANESLIKELLVVVDDFDSALFLIKDEKSREGLSMLYKNFLKTLEKHGLKKIEALGGKFNPHLHEALIKEKSEKDEGIILEEIQKGFTLKSKVIRPSKVRIAENKIIVGKNGH